VKKRGFFITVEGGDGAGKSTQAGLLAAWFRARGFSVVHTREPGGTSIAEAVRKVLLRPQSRIAPMTELFLYEAARAQHVAEVVAPALAAGKLVLCERYTDATEAYQGWGRGLDRGDVALLNRVATGGLRPDLTVLLGAPVHAGLRRARGRKAGADRLEREPLAFHRRVAAGYRAIARREPGRVRVVAWRDGAAAVHALVVRAAEDFLKKARRP
jgi:dTMP kinase